MHYAAKDQRPDSFCFTKKQKQLLWLHSFAAQNSSVAQPLIPEHNSEREARPKESRECLSCSP